jgi:D-alanyl-D-alanine carboxypeptidase/D-alanyl-D-alanine-endopeptidase (penicillin-binding protein 4)
MLRESDNSTAELLLKELGRTEGDPSTAGGRRVASAALLDAGVDLGGVVIADGSGLSLDNRLTCDVLVELLREGDAEAVLEDGLAVAGETGTLAERFEGTPLDGALRAKTGTLNTVTALTGVTDDDDPPLTFALITNLTGAVVSLELIGEQAHLAEILLAWPRVPDLSVLGPEPLSP